MKKQKKPPKWLMKSLKRPKLPKWKQMMHQSKNKKKLKLWPLLLKKKPYRLKKKLRSLDKKLSKKTRKLKYWLRKPRRKRKNSNK